MHCIMNLLFPFHFFIAPPHCCLDLGLCGLDWVGLDWIGSEIPTYFINTFTFGGVWTLLSVHFQL
jgi:hypothetical protein